MKAEQTHSTKQSQRQSSTPFFSAQPASPFFSSQPAGKGVIQRDPLPETTAPPATETPAPTPAATTPAATPTLPAAAPSPTSRPYLGELIGGLLQDQIGDSGLRGHINTLAGVLQGLAEDATDDEFQDPDRLAALGVEGAFRNAATAIIADPGLRALRQTLIETISDSDTLALVTALAGGIAAYFMDVAIEGSPDFDLGRGATMGTSFDLGTAQSIEFNRLQIFAQYASTYFQTRSTVGLRREVSEPDAATGDPGGEETFIATAVGSIRLGTQDLNLTGRYTLGTDGTVIFTGIINGGYNFGGGNRISFATDVTHDLREGSTMVRPSLAGRFALGRNQSLSIGAAASVSTDDGLEALSGHIEYQRSWMQLRLEGNMTGIDADRSLMPISPTGDFGPAQPLVFQAALRAEF